MKKFLDAADRFTQVATAGVLALFAVVCMLAGCSFDSGDHEPKTAVMINSSAAQKATEATTDEITTTEKTTIEIATLTEEETELEYFDLGEFKLTAYCPCYECSEGYGNMTATGVIAKEGRTIAVDQDVIPFGSEVIINGHIYRADDTGGAIIGNHIDIYFDSHEDAEAFGVQYGKVMLKVGDAE
jgi:3D (Asp-Asp-Asp) domain-containing protein